MEATPHTKELETFFGRYEKFNEDLFEIHKAEMQAFFRRYKKFTEDRFEIRVNFFETRFDHLRIGLAAIMSMVREMESYRSSTFNLFNLLGIAHLEVSTHSAMLADLLNPEGSHGQRHLFLTAFIEYMKEKLSRISGGNSFPAVARDDVISSSWFVDKEKSTEFGNMDIVVSSPELRFLVVIENKIGAGEQQEQIARYALWMENQREHYEKRVLLYLTPEGIASQTCGRYEYFKISYRKDINAWLASILPKVKSERVRQSLQQYIEVVQNL